MIADDGVDRTFVLGLDGIPWRLVDQWTAEGALPNLARIVDEGAAGPLESSMPPTTAVAWPSIVTGVGPDHHGLYSFRRLTAEYGHEVNTSADRRSPALWDLISPAVVANVPMTYPAQEIDGVLIAGMMAPTIDEEFTWPRSVADELTRRIPEYQVGLRWSDYEGREDEFKADLSSLVSARRELMRWLMTREDPRLFFFVYTAPDRLQHLIWDEATIKEHYGRLDDIVGEVMEYVAERDGTLYVVSDHGFGPVDRLVRLNRILESAGFLRRETGGTRSVLESVGLTKETVMAGMERFGIVDGVIQRLPEGLIDRVASQVPGGHGLYDVAFSESQAFAYGTRSIYVNDTTRFERGTVEPARRDAVKAEVRETFERVTDPNTGRSILRVYDGDELFPADDDSPDLVVEAASGYLADTGLDGPIIGPANRDGAHEREGIFLAWGEAISAGSRPRDATVFDVAPTVLHGTGRPIPTRSPGRVLTEVFEPGSAPATRQPSARDYVETDDRAGVDADFSAVEDRLRGLGYIE